MKKKPLSPPQPTPERLLPEVVGASLLTFYGNLGRATKNEIGELLLTINESKYSIVLEHTSRETIQFTLENRRFRVAFSHQIADHKEHKHPREPKGNEPTGNASSTATSHANLPGVTESGLVSVNAPMPGIIAGILTECGSHVEKGQPLIRLEAMKMQNSIPAPVSGQVESIAVTVGQEVSATQLLIAINSEKKL